MPVTNPVGSCTAALLRPLLAQPTPHMLATGKRAAVLAPPSCDRERLSPMTAIINSPKPTYRPAHLPRTKA